MDVCQWSVIVYVVAGGNCTVLPYISLYMYMVYTYARLVCCTHCHTPTPLHQLINVMQRDRGRRRRPCICEQLSTAVYIHITYICIGIVVPFRSSYVHDHKLLAHM